MCRQIFLRTEKMRRDGQQLVLLVDYSGSKIQSYPPKLFKGYITVKALQPNTSNVPEPWGPN